MSSVINRIRAKGYWDLAIRPEPYRSDLIAYEHLDDILGQAVVRLRGWPVPFIDHRVQLLRGQHWIGQDIDARMVAHEEAWRFFTSGQFTQLRVISADRRVGVEAMPVPAGASHVIEVWEILFYLTEVVELASRLALSEASGDGAHMTIDAQLHGLNGRVLVAGTPARESHADYQAATPSIRDKRRLRRNQLIAEPREVAVDMARAMLSRFGFKASQEVLSDYQRELTVRR